jgi:polysaccharide pyruvyl transferase WcaK-like protein
MKTCLYTPGLADHQGNVSANLGDLIIQEAVVREINDLLKTPEIFKLPSHIFPKPEHIAAISDCKLAFVGGSNLLESRMNEHKKWQVSLRQQLFLAKPILLGVGWRVYQDAPNFYTRHFLRFILSKCWNHSVRDSFTLRQLQAAGIKNVINTGCPTMWPFLEFDFSQIPCNKANTVLVMVTDYEPDSFADRHLLEILGCQYDRVIAWPQGSGDKEYLIDLVKELPGHWELLDHTFKAFQSLLQSDVQFDYIGTRLHGGIKCLLSGRRSLVLEIDNRAKEIAKDTGLPTIARGEFERL